MNNGVLCFPWARQDVPSTTSSLVGKEVGGLGGLGRRTACPTTPRTLLALGDDILRRDDVHSGDSGVFKVGGPVIGWAADRGVTGRSPPKVDP